jgi:hypothetical protein
MKFIICFLFMIPLVNAADLCTRYEAKPRYTKALHVVANFMSLEFQDLCSLNDVLDIEVQPSRIVTRDGDIIPHVQVQLHRAYSSCLFMVNDGELSITEHRCYSGF